ncbi:aldo/keto reductase (plasmid) [Rhizobium sp. CB3171]|uniref:aldo/keto reductase n=1 Tax=Rhizobium sp. CB3171 TaxID=3039157 RepID=UPI0024B25DCD|nr:aldo/keto reductase [Rhizobium sp. CB3171]WFU05736.1 aldo/keto reductase [Rhizobium sp. CB3171]
MEYVTLNNGVQMPKLGLGVFRMDDAEVRKTVPVALEEGYRLIDTASRYYNEKAVGAALAESGVPRADLFVTTKLWFKDYGYAKTKEAFQVSLDNLGLDYLDLYLMHQPFNDYYGAWRAMEELLDEGRVRAIGLSNFYADRFLDLVTHNRVIPAVNQRETHPLNQQVDTLALLQRHGTVLQAWGPLAQGNQEVLTSSALANIAAAHGKSVAQVILRWLVQRDVTMVVKSTRVARLRENIDIFDFHLSEGEMSIIGGFDRHQPLAGFTHQDPRMIELLLTLA